MRKLFAVAERFRIKLSNFPVKVASKKVIIPEGTILYHGAPNKSVPAIEESGALRSIWTKENQSGKRGVGDITEEGLIWVTPDKNRALGYAKGAEGDEICNQNP